MPESSLGLCRQRAFGPEALFGWASAWPHPENHPRGGGQKTRGGRGVTQEIWTFDGEVSGPTIEGHLCEFFYVTLVDHTSRYHSIDFHAAEDRSEICLICHL